jgi:RNA polymerase sigma-70 factor, ECF subfamily
LSFSTIPDASIMELIAKEQSEALGELYDRYGRLVYTVAINVVWDAETAEEITQDVFLRAWEGAQSYRPELAKVSSWLVSITRHRAIDELRRRGARPEAFRADWPEDIGQDHANGMPLLENPEGEVETVLQSQDIQHAIAVLPREQRVVLNLAFFKGYSHSQIAEFLGEPLGTVKSRVRLAMLKLRDVLIQKGVVEPGSEK